MYYYFLLFADNWPEDWLIPRRKILMRKILVLLILNCGVYFAEAQPKTPAQLYGDLFNAVQMQRIYPDGKTFPDASPRRSPEKIMKDYMAQKDKPDFNLDAFVKQN